MEDFIKVSIGSYESREKNARKRAIEAIVEGSYNAAAIALQEAACYKACADELRLQIEMAEANNA